MENILYANTASSMTESLFDYLKKRNIYKSEVPKSMVYRFPYSVKAITGLLLHSWLSAYSPRCFCTDTNYIYLEYQPMRYHTGLSEEEMVIQDCLVKVIDAHPDTLDIYYQSDELMFVAFEHSFRRERSIYDLHLEKLRPKYPTAIEIEDGQIKLNIVTFKDSIDDLLNIVKEEDSALFNMVTQNLNPYGYVV